MADLKKLKIEDLIDNEFARHELFFADHLITEISREKNLDEEYLSAYFSTDLYSENVYRQGNSLYVYFSGGFHIPEKDSENNDLDQDLEVWAELVKSTLNGLSDLQSVNVEAEEGFLSISFFAPVVELPPEEAEGTEEAEEIERTEETSKEEISDEDFDIETLEPEEETEISEDTGEAKLESKPKTRANKVVAELHEAINVISDALVEEVNKEVVTSSYEDAMINYPDVSARYWLMQFLEPLSKRELKSIIDGFLIHTLNTEQASKLVRFLLLRFPDYYTDSMQEVAIPSENAEVVEDAVEGNGSEREQAIEEIKENVP